MENDEVVVIRVGTTILLSDNEDWTNCIRKIIDSKNQVEVVENPVLNDIEKYFVETICVLIEQGIYFTIDLDTLNITKRYVLDISISTSPKMSYSNSINANNFRSMRSREIQKRIDNYFTSLVDPKVGIFNGHYRGISDSMPLIAFDGQLGTRDYDAYGRANTYRDSYYTGLLEALERFHGLGSSTVKSIVKSEIELKEEQKSFVPFEEFSHYDSSNYEQSYFEFPIYSPNKKISWIDSYSVIDKKIILIPEQTAYFSCEQIIDAPNEPRYISETSSGTALGGNWYEASIAAILELIERDSFLVHWYTKSKPKRLNDNEKIDDQEVQMILGYLDYIEYQTHIFDITLETGIPTYWVLLEYVGKEKQSLSFYTAAGSNFNEVKAIKSALIEASTSVKVFKEYMSAKYTDDELTLLQKDFNEVKKLEDHLYLFSDDSMRRYLNFALEEPIELSIESSIENHKKDFNYSGSSQMELFESLINRIKTIAKNIYITNLSTDFLDEIGFSCVKVHIPDFQNIGFGMQYQNVNNKRLIQALDQNNLDGNLKDIYVCPHPFP